uniref:Uncharacterized protein n=1 Tax=Arundo donax TaxID=35708 RepID=A0A0A9F0Y7_ARUDO
MTTTTTKPFSPPIRVSSIPDDSPPSKKDLFA